MDAAGDAAHRHDARTPCAADGQATAAGDGAAAVRVPVDARDRAIPFGPYRRQRHAVAAAGAALAGCGDTATIRMTDAIASTKPISHMGLCLYTAALHPQDLP